MKRFVGLVTLVLLAGGGLSGWWWLRASLPVMEGELALPGLRAPVEVLFDGHGIPSAYARDTDDVWLAAGALHARDRRWQMELYRRLTFGQLSELLGDQANSIDARFLTLDLRGAARAEWQRASPQARVALQRYSDGVNAASAELVGRRRPIEFQLLGIAPPRWEPIDSLAIGRLLAWRFSENDHAGPLRAALAAKFGEASARQIFDSSAAPKSHIDRKVVTGSVAEGLDWLAAGLGSSHSWVLGGQRTKSGQPILANDVHLPIELPSAWYEMHLVAAGLDVLGATVPGVPFVLLGHNARVAWALATGDRHSHALRGDTIGDSASAFEALNRVSDWSSFVAAVEALSPPWMSVTYADVEGNVGYVTTGTSAPASRATYPANDTNRFTGVILSDGTGDFRGSRLRDRLSNVHAADVDAMAAFQNDRRSLAADAVLAGVDSAIKTGRSQPQHAAAVALLERLAAWDRVVDARPIVTLYHAFEDALWKRSFVDEMDEPLFDEFYEAAGAEPRAGLYAIVGERESRWFDDITTVERRENRDDIFLLAIRDADEWLADRFGGESNQSWDRVHAAAFRHPLGRIAFPFRWLLSRGPIPVEGDGTTIMRVNWKRRTPFAASQHPSWRQLLHVGRWDESRASLPGGQSGHPMSPFYFDQNAIWRKGQYRLQPFSRDAVRAAAKHRLLFVP